MKDALEIINELIGDLEKTPAAERSPFIGGVIGALRAARDNAQWELDRQRVPPAPPPPPPPPATSKPAPN